MRSQWKKLKGHRPHMMWGLAVDAPGDGSMPSTSLPLARVVLRQMQRAFGWSPPGRPAAVARTALHGAFVTITYFVVRDACDFDYGQPDIAKDAAGASQQSPSPPCPTIAANGTDGVGCRRDQPLTQVGHLPLELPSNSRA
jgi:hypothetical protein